MGNNETSSRRNSSSSNNSIMAASTPQEEKVLSQLECGICFNKYESRNIIPMSLKCGHTYCNLCIEKLIPTSPECPSCRENISQTNPVKNYAILDLISNSECEERKSETLAIQLEALKEETEFEIKELKTKLWMLKGVQDDVDDLLKERPKPLPVEDIKGTIKKIKSTINSIKQWSEMIPKAVASSIPDPMNYMLEIYGKVESGTKILCIHQPTYNSGLAYGKVSSWSNTLFFHSLTMKSSNNSEELLCFDDLKKVLPVLKIKPFLKVKSTTKANQIILIKPSESALLPQFIRLCTGETGSCYKDVIFEKGEDIDSHCKSVMKLNTYQKGSASNIGNVDYAFENSTENCYRDSETVVVGSLDGGFQIFKSNSKVYHKNVIGVIESPLNLKDILAYDSYDNVKILESGIAFQF